MSIPTPLLELRELKLKIGNVRICDDLSLTIESGSSWAILGPNGAGKTTLLHTLAGLRIPSSDLPLFQGRPIDEYSRRQLARSLGVLFQGEESQFPRTLFEAVLAGRHPHLSALGWERPADLAITREAIGATGLTGLEQRQLNTLSGGEQQRMQIATLLAQQPRLALLDEPTNHLDPGQQIQMLELLQQRFVRDGHALLMVLHDISLACRFCDNLLLLRGDGQWKKGARVEIANKETISWLYGHPVSTCRHGEQIHFVFD